MHNREGRLQFPEGFLWGTATASYQVEGAVQENGRVPSIWDTFSHTPGKVLLGHTGDVACDHFHRYKEDIALMADLGIDSYRFSLAWPRVVSEDGRIHADGFDFYKRLVDELLRHDIAPAATLFHWDLPQFLEDRGGWSNFIQDGDMETIASEIDFLGVNFYGPGYILDNPGSESLVGVKHVATGRKVTDMGWEVEPQALYELLNRLQGSTDKPLYITENGAAYDDFVVDGKVDDEERIEYIRGHLEAAHRFIAEGGNLKGYYLWSLLDNFEWAYGYTKRFGITYVDFETQQRVPKGSFHWYERVIAQDALPGVLRPVE